jgi:hypothetical protein
MIFRGYSGSLFFYPHEKHIIHHTSAFRLTVGSKPQYIFLPIDKNRQKYEIPDIKRNQGTVPH